MLEAKMLFCWRKIKLWIYKNWKILGKQDTRVLGLFFLKLNLSPVWCSNGAQPGISFVSIFRWIPGRVSRIFYTFRHFCHIKIQVKMHRQFKSFWRFASDKWGWYFSSRLSISCAIWKKLLKFGASPKIWSQIGSFPISYHQKNTTKCSKSASK